MNRTQRIYRRGIGFLAAGDYIDPDDCHVMLVPTLEVVFGHYGH
jgi:hypothetical protein